MSQRTACQRTWIFGPLTQSCNFPFEGLANNRNINANLNHNTNYSHEGGVGLLWNRLNDDFYLYMPPIGIQDQRPEQSAVHVMKGKERRALCKHSFPSPSPKNNQQAIHLIPADVTGKTGKVFVRGFLSPGHGSFLWSCPAFLGHRVGWLHSRVLRLVTYGG